jgi:hypothetical protein
MGAACRQDRLTLQVFEWLIQGGSVLAAGQLRAGMSLAEVRVVLRGWHESPPSSAALSPESTHLFFTVEFFRSTDQTTDALRLTFDNGKLLVWGDSAEPGKQDRRGATG